MNAGNPEQNINGQHHTDTVRATHCVEFEYSNPRQLLAIGLQNLVFPTNFESIKSLSKAIYDNPVRMDFWGLELVPDCSIIIV